MNKQMLFIPLIGLSLSSCGIINETMWTLQRNRDAIDMSTQAIYENAQAIDAASRTIDENRRQIEAVNKTLRKAGES